MSKIDIIRAWKDEEYRKSLTDAERASLPENPAGNMELTDADMGAVAGGTETATALERTGSGLTLGVAPVSFKNAARRGTWVPMDAAHCRGITIARLNELLANHRIVPNMHRASTTIQRKDQCSNQLFKIQHGVKPSRLLSV